jgi:methionyl-tRNA synthetase
MKMSKSIGNIVRAETVLEVLGADALRYFLLREIVFGSDGSFSFDALVGRYNSDLANGLGNLASRTLTMIQQYRDGVVPASTGDQTIAESTNKSTTAALNAYDAFEFSKGLEHVWNILATVDKFIVERAPWKLVREESLDARQRLDETLYTAAEALRIICGLVYPILPHTSEKIWSQLGYAQLIQCIKTEDLSWGKLGAGQKIGEISPVFPRFDVKSTVEKMKELEVAEVAHQAQLLGKTAADPEAKVVTTPAISIDDFVKVDLRVGEVKSAEAVKGADKLLHLKVDIGEAEPRTIVAGIALAYKPEALVGRKVVIVANLEPRRLRGLTSQGMIVAASLEGGAPVLAGFLENVPVGARLK